MEGAAMGSGREFLKSTRYENLPPPGSAAGMARPPLELPPLGSGAFRLPNPGDHAPAVSLSKAMADRESLRSFGPGAVSLGELSWLLWACQGVRDIPGGRITLRTVPSAGARHALETFVTVNRVDGLAPGLYRYLALSHSIETIQSGGASAKALKKACLDQEMVTSCAVFFSWAAVPDRMTYRYSERGYRYLFLDAGHACQNLCLAAEGVGCGACAIGAFDDTAADQCLGLDGESAFFIYAAAVGKRPSESV